MCLKNLSQHIFHRYALSLFQSTWELTNIGAISTTLYSTYCAILMQTVTNLKPHALSHWIYSLFSLVYLPGHNTKYPMSKLLFDTNLGTLKKGFRPSSGHLPWENQKHIFISIFIWSYLKETSTLYLCPSPPVTAKMAKSTYLLFSSFKAVPNL